MKNFVTTLASSAAVFAVTFVAIDYVFSIPDVTVSYSTNECVKVENYPSVLFGTTQYSCELMPNKYNHIWVK
jgi:hypothetical protein